MVLSDAAIASLATAAIATSFTLVGGVILFLLNRRHQLRQDVLKDQRALRDAKRERLTRTYEATLLAAVGMQHYTSVLRTRPVGWDLNQEMQSLEALFKDADLASARLLVEADATLVAREFEDLFRSFTALRNALSERTQDPQVLLSPIQDLEQKFMAVFAGLRAAIHESLQPLNESIPLDLSPTIRMSPPRMLSSARFANEKRIRRLFGRRLD